MKKRNKQNKNYHLLYFPSSYYPILFSLPHGQATGFSTLVSPVPLLLPTP